MTINKGRIGWGNLLVDVFGKVFCVQKLVGEWTWPDYEDVTSNKYADSREFVKTFAISLTDEQYELLDELLETFTNDDKTIISMRYGLDDGEAKSLAEIGKRLNLSQAQVTNRIRHIKNKILGRKQRIELILVPYGEVRDMVCERMEKVSMLRAKISQYTSEVKASANVLSNDLSRNRLIERLSEISEEIKMLEAELYELEFAANHRRDIDNVSLADFANRVNLSVRPYNALKNAGICTFGEIRKANLEEIKHLGVKSGQELLNKINEFTEALRA